MESQSFFKPKLQPESVLLNRLPETTALLFGRSSGSDTRAICWLLNLTNAEKHGESSTIWTEISHHFERHRHAAVLEPFSQRLWVIGGFDHQDEPTSDVLKISLKLVPLKDLAMDYAARNLSTNDVRLQPDRFPMDLKKDIDNHRSNIGKANICSAEKGCVACQQQQAMNQ